MGAKWDKDRKAWYAPPAASLEKLARWIPRPPDLDVKASRFFLLRSADFCWSCRSPAPVFALAAPRGHEEIEEDDAGQPYWDRKPYPSILSYLQNPGAGVLSALGRDAPTYRRDYSATTKSHYFMNHCAVCGAKMGDHFLHDEPGAPFCPLEGEAPIAVEAIEYPEALEAKAICSVGCHYPKIK